LKGDGMAKLRDWAAARRAYRNAIYCRRFQTTGPGGRGDGGKFALLANLLTEPKGGGGWRAGMKWGVVGGWWGRWRGGWDEWCGDFCLRSKCKNRDSAEGKGGRCGVWQMQRETLIYEGLARVRMSAGMRFLRSK